MICKIDNCSTEVRAKSLCVYHYNQVRAFGEVRERTRERHGMNTSPEYLAWENMKARCFRRSHPHYHLYGGRGISVDESWAKSFIKFYEDMGERPGKGYSLERVDNEKGYCKENCIWTTQSKQNLNKRYKLSNTGFHGVVKNKKRFSARISIDGVKHHLGTYDTPEEAYQVYLKARSEL